MPIDGAWATDDISINNAISFQDIPSSPGNHHVIVLHLNLLNCIGEPRYKVVHPPGVLTILFRPPHVCSLISKYKSKLEVTV